MGKFFKINDNPEKKKFFFVKRNLGLKDGKSSTIGNPLLRRPKDMLRLAICPGKPIKRSKLGMAAGMGGGTHGKEGPGVKRNHGFRVSIGRVTAQPGAGIGFGTDQHGEKLRILRIATRSCAAKTEASAKRERPDSW